VLVVAFLMAPSFLEGSNLQVAVRVLIFATLGVAWNVMSGFAGLFSFGHAAFFGLGAYVSAYLLIEHGISPWIGLLTGAAVAAVYGVLMTGLIVRYRLRGAYFALATFAFAEMLHLISLNMEAINGTEGLRVPIQEESLWMMQFPLNSPKYLYVMLFLFAVAMLVVIQVTRSRLGYRIRAMRDDAESAAAAGIDVRRHALIATAISGALTAAVGAFYVQFLFFIDPPLAFGPNVSVQILLPAIVGGVATIWGPVVGGAVIVVVGEFLARLIASPPESLSFLEGRGGLDLAIYGALLIVIIMYAPKGIYGSLARWRDA
jgi:branched-chain amino acid transport system permease protein